MVMWRTGSAEGANLRVSTDKYIGQATPPTNVLRSEQGLGRHPFEAQGPLALGAVTDASICANRCFCYNAGRDNQRAGERVSG